MNVIVIPAELARPARFYALSDDHDALPVLQEFVGGWIQAVRCGPVELVVNEEGIGIGLPPNQRATALWWANGGPTPQILHGQAVVLGPVVEDDWSSLPPPTCERLLAALNAAGQLSALDLHAAVIP